MNLLLLTNLAAGFYKGNLNAKGIDVDTEMLPYLIAGTSLIGGIHRSIDSQSKKKLLSGRKKETLDEILDNKITEKILGEHNYDHKIYGTKIDNAGKEFLLGSSQRAINSVLWIGIGYGLGYACDKIFN
jgi:hypothetical protein